MFTFHIPAIPHTVTNKKYISCAYTQKVLKLCKMLTDLGHKVYHYGCEGSDVVCTEHISVVSENYRSTYYNTDFHNEQFKIDTTDSFHKVYSNNCAAQIQKRLSPKDFVLCAWGWGHKPIVDQLRGMFAVVESGIGYETTFARFRIFESYNWMHYIYGTQKVGNGIWYDAVIPNFFELSDFEFNAGERKNQFLYLGRIVKRKGVELALSICEKLGVDLVVAGQGTLKNESEGLDLKSKHLIHAGFADLIKRKHLLANCKALIAPTYYLEPFGGVVIEAALSGMPVITTDWGAFPENVIHGLTGYRCRTFEQFLWAAQNINTISPEVCRTWGENFSTERVALMYDEYFSGVYQTWDKGFYTERPGRENLDWLLKTYPPQFLVCESAK